MRRVSSEHWQQVKEIFDAALEREKEERAHFLDEACVDDAALRGEVESLLYSHEQSQSFMESPAVESAAEALIEDQPILNAGDRLKHYEIVHQLGEGGMGEVYLAKDTVLGRLVALKLLPEYLRGDPDRLRRFKQEARTASALNHPNVCVIHEIAEAKDGQPFIAMEYVEGTTLRQRLKEKSINLGDALDIAIQIADALNAAHEAGIIHRDIKPENVMIRRDSYVKVLDFGLAKLTEPRTRGKSETISTLLINSTPGMVMGTVGYMSPEQARGVGTDRRTDVWSLGVLIYEMVSTRPPFEGATPTDIVISIVEKEQLPISHHVASVPQELERIVRKSLRKDPEERYQSVKEMAIDLRSLRRDLALDSLERSIAPSRDEQKEHVTGKEQVKGTDEFAVSRQTTVVPLFSSRRSEVRLAAVLVLAVVVAVGGVWLFRRLVKSDQVVQPRFQRINVTKLTTNGNALMAALSPDGKYLAYVLSDAGKQSLWLRQVAITSNVQVLAPRDGRYLGIAFSPDGNFVYFGYAANDPNDQGEAYRIPVLGVGNTATRLDTQHGPASISHDGKRIAFIHYDRANEADRLIVADKDGSAEQEIARRKWPERFGWGWDTTPAWTTNDESLALSVVNSDASGFFVSIFEIRLADKSNRIVPLSSQRFAEPGDVDLLSDGSAVMLSAEAQGASFPQIWLLSRDGTARSITSDLSDYRGLSLRVDGTAFVTVQRQTISKIWTVPKGDSEKATGVTSGTSRYFDLVWGPDGKIVYASDASGDADIYDIADDGTSPRQLTAGAKRNYAPTVSPDGRYVAFHSNRSGIFQIWRMDRDGSNPKQLTFGNSESNWPVFSGDSKWVIYQHFESGTPGTIWKVPVDGGTAIKVMDGFAIRPSISPDGKLLAVWQNNAQTNSHWRLAVRALDGDTSVKTFEVSPMVQIQWDTLLRWHADGRTVTYVDHRGGIDNLWGQSIDGGLPKQLTNFKEGRIFSFDWSLPGNLVASRGVLNSDVVLITDASR